MNSQSGAIVLRGPMPASSATTLIPEAVSPGDLEALDRLDDAGLVAACRAGQRTAFDVLVTRHQRAIYNLCYRFAGTHEDASDLAQETFLRAYRGVGAFRAESAVSTWLYRIGTNVCLSRASRRRHQMVPLDAAPEPAARIDDPSDTLAAAQQAAAVRAAVARLPERQRATLVLRVYQGRTHKEIADVLGTTEGAAKTNLFHALTNLRKYLSESRP